MTFEFTPKQLDAQRMLAGGSTHQMLFGGSRSGKTFLHVRNMVFRALKAPQSRHAVVRFRFKHVKNSVAQDTFPKVMRLCYPGVEFHIDKQDWFARLGDGSEIWFGGLDDKERTEKILGQEYATLMLNECSQIPWGSSQIALTRLAQNVKQSIQGRPDKMLRPRMYYDCNPPNKAHWCYKQFILKQDPETGKPLRDVDDYMSMRMNPGDNKANLPGHYIKMLEGMSGRMRKRFLLGEFADAIPNQLFTDEDIEKWRVIDEELPDFVRVVVGVDPSGADDVDNADNDAIGIVCGALGTDGNAYLLDDRTVKAGPGTWGKVATQLYEDRDADVVAAETNYGGAMVKQTIHVARARTPFKMLTASRGKVVRAEPMSALYEAGKVRHVGFFPELEAELTSFSTAGYLGGDSPNRADAWIWVLHELFPGIVKKQNKPRVAVPSYATAGATGWMG